MVRKTICQSPIVIFSPFLDMSIGILYFSTNLLNQFLSHFALTLPHLPLFTIFSPEIRWIDIASSERGLGGGCGGGYL
jgi:hypothetical protein